MKLTDQALELRDKASFDAGFAAGIEFAADNESLILAAPALLAAAINIRAFFASNYFGPMLEARCAEIDEAIAKATGGAQ